MPIPAPAARTSPAIPTPTGLLIFIPQGCHNAPTCTDLNARGPPGVSVEADGWSNAEIVRALRRIEAKLGEFSDHFVSKELHDQQLSALHTSHIELAKWVTDIAASAERSAKERAIHETETAKALAERVTLTSARWWFGTALLLVGSIAAVAAIFAH
jgi:hypothetical protein